MKILFTGGGTAGHIFPIIAVIRELKKQNIKKLKFYYIGPRDNFTFSLFSSEGIEIKTIFAGKVRRYFSLLNILDIIKIPVGIIQSFFYIFTISPDLIFSKGGYGSLPVILAGWLLFTPIFSHESDIRPGWANRIGAKFSLKVFFSFPVKKIRGIPVKKIIPTGNPIRKEILIGSKEKAKKLFNLSLDKPIVLILGGSQGAQRINDKILLVLKEFLENFEIIHQTGVKNFEQVRKEAKALVTDKNLLKHYHPLAFLNQEELANAYSIADLIISRAGAGSIFEISAVSKPSILIPLAGSAQNHQVQNSYFYRKKGACLVMEEANFKPHFLLETVKNLFSEPKKLKKMSEKAREFSQPNASQKIADYIIKYINQ